MGHIETALSRMGGLDEMALRDTPAARLDPRAKVAATLAFVVVVASFGRLDLGRLAPLATFPLIMAPLGDVPWRPILVRLALASPFALAVAILEPFLDRAPVTALGSLTISGGMLAALVIMAKFSLSLCAALLLVATTGFDAVCLALSRLGVPRVLVAQLSLTYRYLFVLCEEASRMVRAHRFRAPDSRHPTPRMAGALLGHLLLRATARAERVHTAMRARGFDGTLPVRRRWHFGRRDVVFAGAVFLLLVATRTLDVPGLVSAALSGSSP